MYGRRETSTEFARGRLYYSICEPAQCSVQNWEWPGNNKQKWQRSDCGQTSTSDGHRFGAGAESASPSASSLLFRERREDRRTYIQLGWEASDAFSRSSRSQGSNRGHMTLQSSVNIARDPVSLHRIVGACACGSLAVVLYSLLSVAGPLTLPHWSAAGPSPTHPSPTARSPSTPTRGPLRHYTTTLLHYRYRFVTFDSSTVPLQWTRYPATRRIFGDRQYFIVKIKKKY